MRQDSETNIIVLNTALKYKIQRNTHTKKHKYIKYQISGKRYAERTVDGWTPEESTD